MIAYCHEKTITLFTDVHAALYLVIYVLSGPLKEYPGVCITYKNVSFAVLFRYILHIRCRFQHKAFNTKGRNIVNIFGIIPIGGKQNLFPAVNQGSYTSFQIWKNKFSVPLRSEYASTGPANIIMNHNNRGLAFRQCLKILQNKIPVPVGHLTEFLGIIAACLQQQFPAEHLYEAGNTADIAACHINRIREVFLIFIIVGIQCLNDSFFVNLPVFLNRIKVKDLPDVIKMAVNFS